MPVQPMPCVTVLRLEPNMDPYTRKIQHYQFSSNSGRCYQTSRYFARGFLGDDFKEGKTVKFNIISEDADVGANSLTPRSACSKNKELSSSTAKNITQHI